MSIYIGSWIFPLGLTIMAFAAALYAGRNDGKAYGYAAAGAGVISLIFLCGAAIFSLAVWLVWSLLT